MVRTGIIYDWRISPLYGEVVISLISPAPFWVSKKFSLGLVVVGLAGLLLTFQPILVSELSYRLASLNSPRQELSGFGNLAAKAQAELAQENPEKEYAKNIAQQFGITDTKFYIYIPKINARSPIIRNVDPASEASFAEALKEGVAHADGTDFPGGTGATFLFAHSTNAPWNIARYNAVFYALKDLKPEDHDEIYVFYQDKLYKYQVTSRQIVDGDDVSWLNNAKYNTHRLLLQTCWPPGTTWKRLIIVAEPVSS